MRESRLTPRLILRDIAADDAPLLIELDSDPAVMRYLGSSPPADLDACRQRIAEVYVPWQAHPWVGIWLILDRSTESFLGWVFARPATASRSAAELGWTRDDEVEIGYRLRASAWGRGIATEAATVLVDLAVHDPAVSAIVGCALKENAASLRVLEKLGLRRVAEVTLHGEGRPTVKMARVKE